MEMVGSAHFSAEHVSILEKEIDEFCEKLPILKSFLIPGTGKENALANMSRCICRRFERNLVSLGEEQVLSPNILAYFNRLGDWLFAFSRFLSMLNGESELEPDFDS
jgi:cob(I)alamin adenosyltransferase